MNIDPCGIGLDSYNLPHYTNFQMLHKASDLRRLETSFYYCWAKKTTDFNWIFFSFHPCFCSFAKAFHLAVYLSGMVVCVFQSKSVCGIGLSFISPAVGKMPASIYRPYWSLFPLLSQLSLYWSLKQSWIKPFITTCALSPATLLRWLYDKQQALWVMLVIQWVID